MAAGPVIETKVFLQTCKREKEGGKKNDTNAPYEKNRLDQRLVGREEGKPFHQVLEIQAAGS